MIPIKYGSTSLDKIRHDIYLDSIPNFQELAVMRGIHEITAPVIVVNSVSRELTGTTAFGEPEAFERFMGD